MLMLEICMTIVETADKICVLKSSQRNLDLNFFRIDCKGN